MAGIWCVQVHYSLPMGADHLLHYIAHTETMSLPGLLSGGSKPSFSPEAKEREDPNARGYVNRLFFESYEFAMYAAMVIESVVKREGGRVLRMEVFPGESIYDPFPILWNPARNPMKSILHVRFSPPNPHVGANVIEEIISTARPDYAEHGTMGPVRTGDREVMYFFTAMRFNDIFRASHAEQQVKEILQRKGLMKEDTWVSLAPTTLRYRVAPNKMKVRLGPGGRPVPAKPAKPSGAYVTTFKVKSPAELFKAIIRARMIADMATFMHEIHYMKLTGETDITQASIKAGPPPPQAVRSAERLVDTVEKLNKTHLVDLFNRAVKAVEHTGEVYAPRHFAVFLAGFALGTFEPGFALQGFDFQIPQWKYPETAKNPMVTAVIRRDAIGPDYFTKVKPRAIWSYLQWADLPAPSRELEMIHPRWMPIRTLVDVFKRIGIRMEPL